MYWKEVVANYQDNTLSHYAFVTKVLGLEVVRKYPSYAASNRPLPGYKFLLIPNAYNYKF